MDLQSLTLRELTDGFVDVTVIAPGQGSSKSKGPLSGSTLRRCRTREHGKALLTISHAIEYLLDSRLARHEEMSAQEREALAILLNANLSVYQQGAEIIPLTTRLRQWFHGGVAKNAAADATA